jgi:predicted class III extradiol MEMO1 family dioxygenase
LTRWESFPILELPRYEIYNTSICKADGKYVLMFEISVPKEEAGVPYTARFATSNDLRHWKVTPKECNYAKDRYTAPHCLRYLDGYFYNFYLESIRGGYEQYVVRSKDFIHWEPSPLNPVLRASDDDRKVANCRLAEKDRLRIAKAVNKNNSDIDFCEHQGRLIINYSWGNQTGVEHLAEAVYEGSTADFLRGWFREKRVTADIH